MCVDLFPEPLEVVGGQVLLRLEVPPEVVSLLACRFVARRAVSASKKGPEMRLDDIALTPPIAGAFVRQLWDQHVRRERDNGRALWCVLTLMIWHDLFVGSRRFRDFLPR